MHTLLLGSSSVSRQILLKEAKIPFVLIGHTADEDAIPKTSVQETVLNIARFKMEHVAMPQGKEGDVAFVLTADSMVAGPDGVIYGKPKDYADAVKIIRVMATGVSFTYTGFCIEKRTMVNGAWKTERKIESVVGAGCRFAIPEHWIKTYIENSRALEAAGATTIELYGGQFLQSVEGSFTAVMGLPMFEVRQALEELGFF